MVTIEIAIVNREPKFKKFKDIFTNNIPFPKEEYFHSKGNELADKHLLLVFSHCINNSGLCNSL
jgi:hypothetical protein